MTEGAGCAIIDAYSQMTVSVSGMRKIFDARGCAEGRGRRPAGCDLLLLSILGETFARFLCTDDTAGDRAADGAAGGVILVARDTRPTGRWAAGAVMHGIRCAGEAAAGVLPSDVRTPADVAGVYLGVLPTPQLLAYSAAAAAEGCVGWIMITASHNPVGYNGLKFGRADGRVLGPQAAREFIGMCKSVIDTPEYLTGRARRAGDRIRPVRAVGESTGGGGAISTGKPAETRRAYHRQIEQVLAGLHTCRNWDDYCDAVKPVDVTVCVDYNGSARAASLDKEIFAELGITVRAFADRIGAIRRPIEPEGPALDYIRGRVAGIGRRSTGAPVLGVLYDNDGDRGNIVYYDRRAGRAEALVPQQLFALMADIALAGDRQRNPGGAAACIVANDATSARIESIAETYGAQVVRCEVGEANVIAATEKLRAQGRRVVLAGEGSNGGVILAPSQVRDPLLMLLYITHALRYRDEAQTGAPAPGAPAAPGESPELAERIGALPRYQTTLVTDAGARITIAPADPAGEAGTGGGAAAARTRYCLGLCSELQNNRPLAAALGGDAHREVEITLYVGTKAIEIYSGAIKRLVSLSPAQQQEEFMDRADGTPPGGLRVTFRDADKRALAALWWRGSGTEPVVRSIVDVAGDNHDLYRQLQEINNRLVLSSFS